MTKVSQWPTWIHLLLRLLAGSIFVFSAATKQISIDRFELYIFSLGWFSLDISTIIARLVVAGEVLIGLMLITGLYQRFISRLSVLTLTGFSLFIIWLWIGREEEHCHCFGDIIELTHWQSLLKNILIMILLLPLLQRQHKPGKLSLFVTIPLFVFSLSIPFILSPPDFFRLNYYSERTSFNETALDLFVEQNQLDQDKYVLCFFGVKCRFCKMAAEKMSVVMEKSNDPEIVTFVFWGNEEGIEAFYQETGAPRLPYLRLDSSPFLRITDGRMPLIVLLNRGEVVGKYRYRDFRDEKILEFLNSAESFSE